MLTEKIVGYVARKKNEDYLRFDPNAKFELPVRTNVETPLMLYVHIPFCEELCTYCSFHRVSFREGLAKEYFAALRKEILMYKERNYNFKALYIGGGTPTVLIDELVETIELIKSLFDITEISVETNPNHLDADRMKPLSEVGVNRLSVGVQSFNDEILKATERYHKYGSGEEVAEKIAALKGYFDTLNVDMIFNFPTQTEEMLKDDLETLLKLEVDQITFYPLMVSSSTRKIVDKKLGVVDDERGRAFYERITSALGKDYETSTAWCFSRKNSQHEASGMIDEYVINYDEYAGLGSGAIGYLDGSIYANTFDIPEYIRRVGKGEFPVTAMRDCSLKEKLLYDFLMQFFGLSLDLDQMSKKYGVDVSKRLWPEIFFFMMAGGLKKEGKDLTLTAKGQYYWVIMMREFFTSVNNFRDHCRSMANLSLDVADKSC